MRRVELKRAFLETGKSQRQVAAEVKVSENLLSKIVCGWRAVTPEEQRAIARALGRPVSELFGAESSR